MKVPIQTDEDHADACDDSNGSYHYYVDDNYELESSSASLSAVWLAHPMGRSSYHRCSSR